MAGAMIDAVTAVAWAWHSHSRTTMNGTVVAGAMNGTATAGAKAWQSHSKALPIDGRACSASFEHQTLFWISLISFCLRFVTHALLCARKTQVGYDFVKEAYSVSSCRDYKPGEEVLAQLKSKNVSASPDFLQNPQFQHRCCRISYGELSNDACLQLYGFVENDNPYDRCAGHAYRPCVSIKNTMNHRVSRVAVTTPRSCFMAVMMAAIARGSLREGACLGSWQCECGEVCAHKRAPPSFPIGISFVQSFIAWPCWCLLCACRPEQAQKSACRSAAALGDRIVGIVEVQCCQAQ
eukprot:1145817-Pelagomonas_calceolata.AAC.2